jgi:hypothetical protein
MWAPESSERPTPVGVLLQDRLGHLLGRLAEPRVDDLEAGVTQGSRDHLGTPVVAVEAGLGDHDAVVALHEWILGTCPPAVPKRHAARGGAVPRRPDVRS